MKKQRLLSIIFPVSLILLLSLALVPSGCGGSGGSGGSGPSPVADITGTWKQTDPCDPQLIFDLVQNGEDLAGIARDTSGTVLGPLAGTIQGVSVILKLTLPFDLWQRFNMTVSGIRMSGTWSSSSGMSGNLNMEKMG